MVYHWCWTAPALSSCLAYSWKALVLAEKPCLLSKQEPDTRMSFHFRDAACLLEFCYQRQCLVVSMLLYIDRNDHGDQNAECLWVTTLHLAGLWPCLLANHLWWFGESVYQAVPSYKNVYLIERLYHLQVWPGEAYWPDYLSHPKATSWLTEQIKAFYKQAPFDGLW